MFSRTVVVLLKLGRRHVVRMDAHRPLLNYFITALMARRQLRTPITQIAYALMELLRDYPPMAGWICFSDYCQKDGA